MTVHAVEMVAGAVQIADPRLPFGFGIDLGFGKGDLQEPSALSPHVPSGLLASLARASLGPAHQYLWSIDLIIRRSRCRSRSVRSGLSLRTSRSSPTKRAQRHLALPALNGG